MGSWNPGGSPCQTFLDVLCSLDPGRVLRTILNFPRRRSLANGDNSVQVTEEEDRTMYDPALLILLLAYAFADSPPQTALSWVQLYRTNVISLLIRCLSATDSKLRSLATLQLSALWKVMQVCHFMFPYSVGNIVNEFL